MLVRARLVDQVDGLVRQAAVREIALGQPGSRLQGLRLVGHLVVLLVLRSDALEDAYGLVDAGLTHQDRVEAPLQGLVRLDEAVIFVQGVGTDHLHAALCQGRLQHARGVQSTAAGAGPHYGV